MNPSTSLLLPPPELQGCVRAVISRDTTGSALSMTERLNRFPSTPLCTITWFLAGKAITVEPEEGVLLDRIVASGPLTRPVVTFNPGPVRAFMAIFYPSAWHQMCGLEPGDIVDRFIDPSRLGPGWKEMAQAVLQAPDDDERLALLAAFLRPRWTPAATQPAASWLERLKEAAHAGAGASARSIERRFKAIGGQPLRTLRRLTAPNAPWPTCMSPRRTANWRGPTSPPKPAIPTRLTCAVKCGRSPARRRPCWRAETKVSGSTGSGAKPSLSQVRLFRGSNRDMIAA